MKDITLKRIEKLNNEFNSNKTYKAMKNALSLTPITKIVNVNERLMDNTFIFEHEIKTMSACNQKGSGRCWIFAGLNVLREIVANRLNIESLELSQNYVAFYDKLEKINYALETLIELHDVSPNERVYVHVLEKTLGDGGQWDMFVSLIKKYGIVPKNVMEETYQSSYTREMRFVIDTIVRKFACESQKLKNIDEIRKLKDKALDKAYNFLCMCFGMPLQRFNFEYKDKQNNYYVDENITPLEFYDKYIGVDLDSYISIINSPTKDKPFYKTYTVKYLGNVYGNKVRYLNLPMKELKDLCRKQIKSNELVWFGCDSQKYAEKEKGYWDDLAFDYSVFDIDLNMEKNEMLDYGQSVMVHAMVITGFSKDKWKIENSWGTDRADKGYFVMSDSWFDKYTYQAVINKKYLTKEQLKALEGEDIELEPWDPMGTLA